MSVAPVERAVLRYCSDQINLTALLSGEDAAQPVRARLAACKARMAELEQQIERITTALLESADAAPLAFARRARALEEQLAAESAEAAQLEQELALIARRDTPAIADAWQAIADGALALDEQARLQARQLVADTFSRIVIYHSGLMPGDAPSREIEMLLIAKSGGTRMLRVDRRTGAWRAGVVLSNAVLPYTS